MNLMDCSRNVSGWLVLLSPLVLSSALCGQTSPANKTCCPVLELRQYTLYPGKRDVLIELFDREFVETQEAVGAHVLGQFRDLDNPNRFVWLRGFNDMNSRVQALESFYGGPVWKAHRDEANATMEDSSNVLLLQMAAPNSGFDLAGREREPAGSDKPITSLVVATIYYLKDPVSDEFIRFFERSIAPIMSETGARPIAFFKTETAENNFPRLPIRTGGNVLVWFASYGSAGKYGQQMQRLEQSKNWARDIEPQLSRYLKSPPEHLRLQPTTRSLLR